MAQLSYHRLFGSSVLAKAWYHGAAPRCNAEKIINYVVVNKVGPTLVATWQVCWASTATALGQSPSCVKERNVPGLCQSV